IDHTHQSLELLRYRWRNKWSSGASASTTPSSVGRDKYGSRSLDASVEILHSLLHVVGYLRRVGLLPACGKTRQSGSHRRGPARGLRRLLAHRDQSIDRLLAFRAIVARNYDARVFF